MAPAVSYHDALKVLDLLPSASSAEAEAAYRDLIKVWHPDRFPTDERLRMKAEEKTKQLTEAMTVIRNFSTAKQAGPPPSASSTEQAPSGEPNQQQFHSHHSRTSDNVVPPVHAHRRFRSSLLYMLASAALLAICFTTLLRPNISAHTGAFAICVALWATREMIKQGFVGAFNVPIFSMNHHGVYIFSHGWFAWNELQEIESRIQDGTAVIAVRLSPRRLATQSIMHRVLLKLRNLLFRAHYLVPFSDLTVSSSAIIAIARHHFAHSTGKTTRTGQRGYLFWISTVEFTSIALAIGWYIFGQDPHPFEVLPYFAIAAACQAVRLVYQRPKRS